MPDPASREELIAALDEHAIVSVADSTGRIVYVNDLFCETSGYTAFELLGSQHNIVKSGEHPPELYRELWETISGGRVWHGELKNRRRDGSFYWVATTIVPVLDEHDLPSRYVSIRTNITAEKLLDEKLLHQRAFLASIAEAVGEGILVEDERGECVFANEEAAQLLGCARDDLLGLRLHDRIVDSLAPIDFANSSREACADPGLGWLPGRYEGEFVGLDGRRRPVLVGVQPMAETGGIRGMVITFRDHSAERRQRDELRRARTAADQANRAKSAFLANMSHEIRTPLNGVLGLARLALDEPVDAPRLRKYLEGIVESAGALTELITDVLDISKIEAGESSLQKVDFDLHDLLHSVQRGFRELASAKGLELPLSIAPDVPAHVTGDRVRVRQILSNFLSNAIKFSSRGRVHLMAKATTDGRVCLAVEDAGIGIQQDTLKQLFRPFVQADESTTRQFGGSGLGLSICRALAQEMGGRVGAESEPGKGSLFWAELPLPAVPPQVRAGEAPPASAADEAAISGMRVLLVEDNETNVVIASALMNRWGVEVVTAQGGREALELIDRDEGRFDIVLMDLHMPQMSGYDVTATLRSRYAPQALPIVALTAAAFEEDREACRRAGMNDFVTKPVSAERLRAVLAKWHRRRAPRGSAPQG
ncbi:ATP-binding protein [Caldimonas sp. KR1-144]|uniref:ATP-binding protein n=1 Tax=Caldimonas sp. KR1-144 TaxID=3400911 RepID=UPI003C2B468E